MYYQSGQDHSGPRQQQLQQFSASKSCSTRTMSLSHASAGTPAAETSSYQSSNTFVQPQTPVLFSTQRGLHLRVTKTTHQDQSSSSSSSRNRNAFENRLSYQIKFCDLERWSTNRANHIGLDDTIASRTFTVQKNNCGNPTKHSMVRFDTSYT